jgi:hypothetical protein
MTSKQDMNELEQQVLLGRDRTSVCAPIGASMHRM